MTNGKNHAAPKAAPRKKAAKSAKVPAGKKARDAKKLQERLR